MTDNSNPPRRLTPPEAFPDLDAALAARGIALKASAARRTVDAAGEPVTDAEPLTDEDERSSPHPAAFAGAVLGLALVGLLVFSVMRVSGDSIRPATPIINVPASSTPAPTPVAELPTQPAATPPTPDVAPPQLAAASQAVPPPPASSPVPSALSVASSVTAQTMVAQAPPELEPESEGAPEDSLRSRLHERFPQLFPAP